MTTNATIRSMTGYGQASTDLPEGKVSVELRTLNHRFADLRLRLPADLAASEPDLRRKILSRVKRGRVEVTVNFEPVGGGEPRPTLNRPLLDEVLAACGSLSQEQGIAGQLDVAAVLGVPGMFRSVTPEVRWDESQRAALEQTLSAALEGLDRERAREGAHLGQEMLQRIEGMIRIATAVQACAAGQAEAARERLLKRLESLRGAIQLDPARVAQEVALLADRSDVTEELVRLEGHLKQARSMLGEPDGDPLGKRIDFLLQEINRETNTINSKSADLELSRHALELKAEIEKVREQAQNLE